MKRWSRDNLGLDFHVDGHSDAATRQYCDPLAQIRSHVNISIHDLNTIFSKRIWLPMIPFSYLTHFHEVICVI